jgi:hypothetical protein
MQPGDVFEVDIEGMGVLSNPIADDEKSPHRLNGLTAEVGTAQ